MKTSVTKGFIHDSIGDMLTRVRNACLAHKKQVITPCTKTNLGILKIMEKAGFIQGFHKNVNTNDITILLKYRYRAQNPLTKTGLIKVPCITNLQRISKPGLRVYTNSRRIPRIFGGTGIVIVSTPEGLMTDVEAILKGVGGELLLYIY